MEFPLEPLFVFAIGISGGILLLHTLISGRTMGLYGMFGDNMWQGKWVSRKHDPSHYWFAVGFYSVTFLLIMTVFIMNAFDVTVVELLGE